MEWRNFRFAAYAWVAAIGVIRHSSQRANARAGRLCGRGGQSISRAEGEARATW